ncbi:MAG TPA: hypothetical protein ENI27_05370 [bacterium]|nr:hypothetical protein [bacterium]
MNDGNDSQIALEKLRASYEMRRNEIELFWKRSLFFWGFIAAAFVALAQSYAGYPRLAIGISCFGLA